MIYYNKSIKCEKSGMSIKVDNYLEQRYSLVLLKQSGEAALYSEPAEGAESGVRCKVAL